MAKLLILEYEQSSEIKLSVKLGDNATETFTNKCKYMKMTFYLSPAKVQVSRIIRMKEFRMIFALENY